MKANNQPRISEALLFQAIGLQRQVVERARRETKRIKAGKQPMITAGARGLHRAPSPNPAIPKHTVAPGVAVDYDKPVEAFNVEIWK